MIDIEMHDVTEEFRSCWGSAGRHLNMQVQGGSLSWLKASLTPPFLEHLSFRIGNQLFYVRIVDVNGRVNGPGNPSGFARIAKECQGHALLMPMEATEDGWEPAELGWGLIDPESNLSVNPLDLVTEEKIEVTEWELLDFGVQVVRDHILKNLNLEIMSTLADPGVDPSIWFVGPDGPEWVVVRVARYPSPQAAMPNNIGDISTSCARTGVVGHFASVVFANDKEAYDPDHGGVGMKLWRGHPVVILNFQGLEKIFV
jgi:hypothetical protein